MWDIEGEMSVCSCQGQPSEDAIFLYKLFTEPKHRHKGYATALMNTIMDRYDTILVQPESFGDMTTQQLIDWYIRLGFKCMNDSSGYYIRMKKP